MFDKQSLLTRRGVDISVAHVQSGGSLRSLASKLGVTRKTVYYWKRRYPEYAFALELARGRLLFKIERLLHAGAFGLDITDEYEDFKNVNFAALRNQAKSLFPEYYNPRTKKFKERVWEEKGLRFRQPTS